MNSAVPSPSSVGLVAMITSFNSPRSHAVHQRFNRQLIGTDALQRRDPSQQYMVQAFVSARAFQCDQIPRLLDHAQLCAVASRVAANIALIALRQVVTGFAIPNVFFHFADHIGQRQGFGLRDPQ